MNIPVKETAQAQLRRRFFVYFLAKGVAFLSSLAYNEGYSIAALPQNKK
jgi:hypothetical protein